MRAPPLRGHVHQRKKIIVVRSFPSWGNWPKRAEGIFTPYVPRGLALIVGTAVAGSSGQTWRG